MPSLVQVSTGVLRQVRDGFAQGSLKTPIERSALVAFGVRHSLDELTAVLAGHRSGAAIAILDAVLAERDAQGRAPEVVWSGPEGATSVARDTAVVLRELFESAQSTVLVAGYRFDHADELLAPLAHTMATRGVKTTFFVDIEQSNHGVDPEARLRAERAAFFRDTWAFDGPRPNVWIDRRSLTPGPPFSSLHAKCVIIDGRRALVSSANFTQRGQSRNIEVGALIDDANFASFLSAQWMGLVEARLVAALWT
jgi:phosphatidylserine/phosphatidylglycerophosphate/cardiolipin synthase-like enzyme